MKKEQNNRMTKKKTILKTQKEEILKEVLAIIDKHDPNVGLERKTSSHFWGNTLRKEIREIINKQ